MSNYRTHIRLGAERFAALSSPARLELFIRLASCCRGGCSTSCSEDDMRRSVGELGSDLGIAPSTVSHHLKELRRAGLIHMERRGRFVDCWVDPETLSELRSWFDLPVDAPEPKERTT